MAVPVFLLFVAYVPLSVLFSAPWNDAFCYCHSSPNKGTRETVLGPNKSHRFTKEAKGSSVYTVDIASSAAEPSDLKHHGIKLSFRFDSFHHPSFIISRSSLKLAVPDHAIQWYCSSIPDSLSTHSTTSLEPDTQNREQTHATKQFSPMHTKHKK